MKIFYDPTIAGGRGYDLLSQLSNAHASKDDSAVYDDSEALLALTEIS